jgi:hypothetical protein
MFERYKRPITAGMLLLFAAATILLRTLDPATSRMFPPCPFLYLTGLYCPGCGSLRAMHQLLHGNFHAAWAMNPLSVILFPFLAYGLLCEAIFYLSGQRLPQVTLTGASIRAVCAVILLFAVARNIPFRPFDLLAPGALLKF